MLIQHGSVLIQHGSACAGDVFLFDICAARELSFSPSFLLYVRVDLRLAILRRIFVVQHRVYGVDAFHSLQAFCWFARLLFLKCNLSTKLTTARHTGLCWTLEG